MLCLRGKSVHNLGEFLDCGIGLGGADVSRRRWEQGFVNYNQHRRRISEVAPRLVIVNNNIRTDWGSGASCSSSSSFVCDDHHRHQADQGWADLGSLITGDYRREQRRSDRDVVVDDGKLDIWVKESVGEILNNLEEAPFLVHIYSDGDEVTRSASSSSSGKTRFVREKATAETWPYIKGRWNDGGKPMPTGIILVEELKNNNDAAAAGCPNGEDGTGSSSCSGGVSETYSSSSRVWGILIQGKGLSCPACYILKTCRVRSVLGCCTHFCLVRVGCFLENVDIQLKKVWLV